MAKREPTPKTACEALRLCYLAIFRPDRFIAEEEADNLLLNARPPISDAPSIYEVRRGYKESLMLCLGSLAAGAIGGVGLSAAVGSHLYSAIAVVVIGAVILLWATLAVRGWEIQTYVGVTLSERVNQWLFRTLCVVGTFLTVVGSVWGIA